jgi:hypothetical protein
MEGGLLSTKSLEIDLLWSSQFSVVLRATRQRYSDPKTTEPVSRYHMLNLPILVEPTDSRLNQEGNEEIARLKIWCELVGPKSLAPAGRSRLPAVSILVPVSCHR